MSDSFLLLMSDFRELLKEAVVEEEAAAADASSLQGLMHILENGYRERGTAIFCPGSSGGSKRVSRDLSN